MTKFYHFVFKFKSNVTGYLSGTFTWKFPTRLDGSIRVLTRVFQQEGLTLVDYCIYINDNKHLNGVGLFNPG